MNAQRLALRALLLLMAALLLVQVVQLAGALWLLRGDAYLVSGFLWGALAFKGLLLLLNAAAVAVLWRLSGLGRARRLLD